jgi:hypothetical protein
MLRMYHSMTTSPHATRRAVQNEATLATIQNLIEYSREVVSKFVQTSFSISEISLRAATRGRIVSLTL